MTTVEHKVDVIDFIFPEARGLFFTSVTLGNVIEEVKEIINFTVFNTDDWVSFHREGEEVKVGVNGSQGQTPLEQEVGDCLVIVEIQVTPFTLVEPVN